MKIGPFRFSLSFSYEGRWIRWLWQKIKCKFSDRELWNLDYTIAEFVYPRLKAFANRNYANPSELTPEQWEEKLGKMVRAFELIVNEDEHDPTNEEWDEIEKGLELFGYWFRSLWT